MDPRLCIMLAHESMVVHTSGPGIHGCASCWPMDPRLCILPAYGSMVVHHAGPVGVDHSMELQPGPLGSIEGTASSPGPGIHGCASSPGPQLQPSPLASIEGIASSPARRGLLLLARSALITRWHSNQVPWDPSKELHRVPSRGDCCCCCWPGQR